MDHNSKSNRAQADYFELLVCQSICLSYNTAFTYSRDLAELETKVILQSLGVERLKIQNDNFVKIRPKIKEILDLEITNKGKVAEVSWVGRKLLEKTTSDVDIKHLSGKATRFSIKSIASSGTGTLKNIGSGKLKKYLNVDFSDGYREMWNSLREHLNDHTSTQAQIKHKVREDRELLDWATENGRKSQHTLNKICVDSFNQLPISSKIDFLNYITDCYDDDLYVIIVNSTSVVIYQPKDKKLKLIKNIKAIMSNTSDVGYVIAVDNVPTYRVQTNNTNGIGISAFCQRIFWI